MAKLSGKVALITGGSTGIGLASAQHFVQEGAHVFIIGRRQAELDKVKAQLGPSVTTVRGDVTRLEDLDRLYAIVKAAQGGIDFLVVNAGFVDLVSLAEATPEHFDKTFNIHARGSFFLVHKALPLLRQSASIVLVSSATPLKAIPVYMTYSATSAAMRSFSRTFGAELTRLDVRVSTLGPGPFDTPMADGQIQLTDATAFNAEIARLMPLGRIGQADEMARAVLLLASNDSSFSNGRGRTPDGGFSQF